MCGIAGVLHRTASGSADRDIIRRMRDVIAYRGPDSAGEYVEGPIGLSIRRLAIIDLTGGTQPITSADGRYTIAFNGEIYNYHQLRKPLESLFPFRTQSDTEVLLYHLIAHGPDGLNDLNGMFAFALWDKKKEELFLARDRFGKKPLYYAELPHVFLFGSEPKSLLAFPDFPRALDDEAITKYFLYEYVPTPQTPYMAMKKLSPGHLLRVSKSETRMHRWWALTPPASEYAPRFGAESLAAQFDAHLHAAVQDRMVADVPVGVLLSGGIDSTTIAWYMRQHTKQLHSFSVSFHEGTFDESSYATMAADALGTTHHAIPFSLENFHTTLKRFREDADEPLGDASFLSTLLVSQEAKKNVTVVLDGDGADELLLGYDTFPAYQASLLLERLPGLFQHAASMFADSLPTRYTNFSLDFKLKSFLRGMPFSGAVRNQVWLGSFHDKELSALLTPRFREHLPTLYQPVTNLEQEFQHLLPLEQLSAVYVCTYLSDDILLKIDRATMFASLEARTPYLDPRLVSFVLQLPLRERYHAWKGKRILKDVMKGRIPEPILQRPKKGFGIPIGQWLRGPLKSLLQETLAAEKIAASGILKPAEVQRLVDEHLAGKADHRKKLWTLMAFQWWLERWAK